MVAHGDAREEKWRGKRRMEWVAKQSSVWLGTVHPVLLQSFSPDLHSKKASTRLNWHPRRYKWTRPFSLEDRIWFLRVCHHVPFSLYQRLGGTKNLNIHFYAANGSRRLLQIVGNNILDYTAYIPTANPNPHWPNLKSRGHSYFLSSHHSWSPYNKLQNTCLIQY